MACIDELLINLTYRVLHLKEMEQFCNSAAFSCLFICMCENTWYSTF